MMYITIRMILLMPERFDIRILANGYSKKRRWANCSVKFLKVYEKERKKSHSFGFTQNRYVEGMDNDLSMLTDCNIT